MVVGCQEHGIALPPARHVAGVVATISPPESLHLEADQSPEESVNEMTCVYPVHSPESIHPEAGLSSEECTGGIWTQETASSPESLHQEAGQSSEKGASSLILVLVLRGARGALGGVKGID